MFTKPRAPCFPNFITLVLLFSLLLAATPTAFPQEQQPVRERRAAPTPSPRPTPPVKSVPVPTATPDETGTPSPAPTQDVAAIRSASTARTLADLQARISAVLQKPELAPAMIGIKVTSLDTGKVLFEQNAHKLLRPASNMKLYTVAAALDRLTPDYRFVTSVYARVLPDANGVIKGDLTIYGRGDPSIAARFNNGNYFKGIDDLAARIVAAGVKRVEGDLVGDESYFVGPPYGDGWNWDDLTWWYGAEVSSLTVNDNALDLFVRPGAQIRAPAVITTGPPDPLLRITNRVTTGPKGSKRDISLYRGLASDEIEIHGTIALDDQGYTGGIGISHPALLFAYLLRASLAKQGITITGKTRTIAPAMVPGLTNYPSSLLGLSSVAIFESAPLGLIAAQTLKPSQNLYTELILRALGKGRPDVSATALPPEINGPRNLTTEALGLEEVKKFLNEAGVPPSMLVWSDGSGLSRNDMITAEATVQLLTYMHRHRYASVFRDALPIAGVDGTLRNRFKGTPAENNLRAKTGTLSSATSLSGYVRDAAGDDLAFSIMVNNYPSGADVRTSCIDPIAILLASFAGKP